jgi:hypothetical protein
MPPALWLAIILSRVCRTEILRTGSASRLASFCRLLRASRAINTVGRRRFNRQLPTSGRQALDQWLNPADGFRGNVIAQPSGQCLGIGYRSLAESESRSNIHPQAFCGSFGERQPGISRDRHFDLSCQGRDIRSFQIRWTAWESSVIAEEHQPRCKRQSVFPAFGRHYGEITGRQQL